MSLPALHNAADTRSITERVNVLIRDYNNPPGSPRYVPVGTVLPFAGAASPNGFLLCNGQAVARTTYAALFAAIGTAYGAGDGSTTFNLPDLRGRVAAGKEDAATRLTSGVSGVDGAALGAAGGDQRLQSHSHAVSDPTHFHYYGMGGIPYNGGNVRSTSGDGTNFGYAATNGSATGISIQNAGSGSTQNVQPTLILNYIIAT